MCGCVILVASTPIYHQPKLMHLSEARLFNKFLAGASLLMSFHLGGHCRQGYDVTRSNFLAGCTRRLPGILAFIIIMPTIPLLGLKLASV